MRRLPIEHSDEPDGNRGRMLLRAAAAGRLVRLAPGRYVDAEAWRSVDPATRHRTRIAAVTPMVSERLVVSHASAAALLDLPWIGEFPERVTMTDPTRRTGQVRSLLAKVGGLGRRIPCMAIDGVRLTDPATTAVDVALRERRRPAVVVADAVLALGVRRADLLRELDLRPTPRARTRARWVIEFADGDAGSAGESLTRLMMHDEGFPTPILQAPFHDAAGLIGYVDFWFPEQGVIVEFDGAVKYHRADYRRGRNPEQVVVDEKRREDRLRAVRGVRTAVRLIWPEIQPGGTAPALLRRAGLRPADAR